MDPCQLNLCEQRCSVFFGRVVCTCFGGYNFNRVKHLASTPEALVKACEDINECNNDNGDCQQVKTCHYFSYMCTVAHYRPRGGRYDIRNLACSTGVVVIFLIAVRYSTSIFAVNWDREISANISKNTTSQIP